MTQIKFRDTESNYPQKRNGSIFNHVYVQEMTVSLILYTTLCHVGIEDQVF